MAPTWLTVVGWIYLSACFCCASFVAYDILFNRRRQQMAIMNFVYPITALYFGPLALWFYWRRARTPHASSDVPGPHRASRESSWVTTAIETSHCGAGCALGDVVSEFAIFWLGITIAGLTLPAEYIGDYVVALAVGIVFQYFAIAPMRGLGLRDGLKAAAKADFISLTAFEIGLFGWMAIMTFVFFPAPHTLATNSPSFWLLMQIGMIIGFFTSWPANVWLVRRGIKVPM